MTSRRSSSPGTSCGSATRSLMRAKLRSLRQRLRWRLMAVVRNHASGLTVRSKLFQADAFAEGERLGDRCVHVVLPLSGGTTPDRPPGFPIGRTFSIRLDHVV